MSDVTTIRVEAGSLDLLQKMVDDAPTPLVWLLDVSATPRGDTLAALLVHAPGPAASLPVDARGRPIGALMGSIAQSTDVEMLEAIERHCLPLHHTHVTSLLVERDLVLDLPPPDTDRFGFYAGAEWTARLFARRRGMLVPASRVRVEGYAAPTPLDLMRVARSTRWPRGETMRELLRSVTDRFRW